MTTNWSEVDAAWAQSERGGEASGHLPYNPITDRYETGGDEIEFAEEGDDLAGEYGES